MTSRISARPRDAAMQRRTQREIITVGERRGGAESFKYKVRRRTSRARDEGKGFIEKAEEGEMDADRVRLAQHGEHRGRRTEALKKKS